ncbi:MAG TPA: hypothetical protein VFU31_24320 [Candidatus Binatia bacterium]|nr:hypothetical protein [Candidatus Binatia bacterium]
MTQGWFLIGVVATLLVTGCVPPSQQQGAQRPPPPEADRNEFSSFLSIRLVSVSPDLKLLSTGTIRIDREYTVKSTYIGKYGGSSTFRSSIFSGSGTIQLNADQVHWRFGVTSLSLRSQDPIEKRAYSAPLGISVEITNLSNAGITIDWNAVSIVDASGEAHKVIHEGVKMADRSSVMASITIAPGGKVEDFIYPSSFVSLRSGDRDTSPAWLGRNFIEGMKPGNRFGVFFPLETITGITEYQFIFEVGEPITEADQLTLGRSMTALAP